MRRLILHRLACVRDVEVRQEARQCGDTPTPCRTVSPSCPPVMLDFTQLRPSEPTPRGFGFVGASALSAETDAHLHGGVGGLPANEWPSSAPFSGGAVAATAAEPGLLRIIAPVGPLRCLPSWCKQDISYMTQNEAI